MINKTLKIAPEIKNQPRKEPYPNGTVVVRIKFFFALKLFVS